MVKRCFLCFFFFLTNAVAQPLLSKVVTLQYISANKVMHLVQPLMQDNERIRAVDHTLVLHVTAHTLSQLRALIHQIDKPPVLFHVSLYQGSLDWLETQKQTVYSTALSAQNPQSQSVMLLNGESAWLSTAKDVPQIRAIGFGFNAGALFESHQVENAVFIRPVLMGSKVRLSIRRVREQLALSGWQQFDEQHLDTTVMVPLNQWVPIGNSQGLLESDASSTLSSAGQEFSQNASLYLKISRSE